MNDFLNSTKSWQALRQTGKAFRVATILLYTAKQFYIVYTTLPVRPGSSYVFNLMGRDHSPSGLNLFNQRLIKPLGCNQQ